MEDWPQLDDETIARIQAYPHCCKILERFMQEIVTPIFSKKSDPQNTRKDKKALDYLSRWTNHVTYSQHPQRYRDLNPRNPIDAFVNWVAVALPALPQHIQALYAAVGYVPGNEIAIDPPEKSFSEIHSLKWTLSVHVLRWMVARDETINEFRRQMISEFPANIGVLSEIEALDDSMLEDTQIQINPPPSQPPPAAMPPPSQPPPAAMPPPSQPPVHAGKRYTPIFKQPESTRLHFEMDRAGDSFERPAIVQRSESAQSNRRVCEMGLFCSVPTAYTGSVQSRGI